jgi:hypothetical protein
MSLGNFAPAHKLDVNGGIRNYANGSAVFRTESTAAGYGAYNRLTTTTNSYDLISLNGDFLIDENGVATRFIIKDSTGNVGIGLSSPTEKLDVNGVGKFRGNSQGSDVLELGQQTGYSGAENTQMYTVSTYDDSGGIRNLGDHLQFQSVRWGQNITFARNGQGGGVPTALFYNGSSDGYMELYKATNPSSDATYTTQVHLNVNGNSYLTGGNLGIGTSSPTYELDVAGDIGVDHVIYHNDDTNTYIQFTNDRIRLFANGLKIDTNETYLTSSDWTTTDKTVRWDNGRGYHGNPRSMAIGYSGGNYGQFGYNIEFTTTSNQHTYAFNDIASRCDLYDGLQVYTSVSGGSAGSAISWTELLRVRNGAFNYKGHQIWHANNDGGGSGLDADTVDGIQASSFLRSDATDTSTGKITFSAGMQDNISNVGSVGGTGLEGDQLSTTDWANLPVGFGGMMRSGNQSYGNPGSNYFLFHKIANRDSGGGWGGIALGYNSNAEFYVGHTTVSGSYATWSKVWNEANDGSGSGLDADLLDGQHGSYYYSSANQPDISDITGVIEGTSFSGTYPVVFNIGGANRLFSEDSITFNGTSNVLAISGNTVWHAGNDGSGSTLDADLLDGLQGSSYWTKGGSWVGDLGSNGYSRVQGVSNGGGEFVLALKNGQLNTLIDGSYFAYEASSAAGGGFWSSYNSAYGNATGFKATGTSTIAVTQQDGGSANLEVTGTAKISGSGGYTLGNVADQIRIQTNGSDTFSFLNTGNGYATGNFYNVYTSNVVQAGAGVQIWDSTHGFTSVLLKDSTYTKLLNPQGNVSMYLGDTGDGNNYYQAGEHRFRNYAGSAYYARIGSGYIRGEGGGTVGTPQFSFQNDPNTGMYSLGADDLGFSAGGSLKYGILNGLNRFYSNVVVGPNNNNSKPYIQYKDGYDTASTPSYSWYYDNGCGMGHPAGSTIAFSTGSAERLRINNSGLSVSGDITINGNTAAQAGHHFTAHNESHYNKYSMYAGSSAYCIGMYSGNAFGGLNDWAMTFTFNDEADRGFLWRDTAHSQGQGAMSLTTNGKLAVAHSVRLGYGESDTTIPGATYRLDVSGSIGATADVVAYISSDKRLKDNIKNIANPLEKLEKLNGVEFDWNDKQDLYKGHDIGVIAQEVEKVLPEIVDTREDGHKAVKYDRMVALLIEAVKEQQQQINELKEKLNG